MARTALCAGLLALAVVPALADPTMGTTPETAMESPEWESVEAEKVSAEAVPETMEEPMSESTTVPRVAYEESSSGAQSVQDAVLDSVMKEVQNLFTSSLSVPGFDTVDQASDTVKQVVDRVRERMASTTNEASRTTSALRGVTTDLLKEIMVQEAVIETLWAVIRDTQVRPWITNEHQALQTATTQAVTAYLSRMEDRMRYAGFSDDDIEKLLPRGKTCGREGAGDAMDTCPSRNMGKKRHGGGGYYGNRSSGYYQQPLYYQQPVAYQQPLYYQQQSYYSEPAYYGSSYPAYEYGGYPRRGFYRRLAEMEEPAETPMGPTTPSPMGRGEPVVPPTPSFPLTGFGPFSRSLLEEAMEEEEFMMTPEPTPSPIMDGPEMRNMGARGRGHYRGYRRGGYPYYGYPSYGRGYYGRGYSSYPSYGYPSYGYSSYGYPSYGYPSYGYSYGYPSYGYRSMRSPYYGYRYMRSVEVPEMEYAGAEGPEPLGFTPATRGPPSRSPMGEPVPMHGSFRRAADVKGPLAGPEGLFPEEGFEPVEAPFESMF